MHLNASFSWAFGLNISKPISNYHGCIDFAFLVSSSLTPIKFWLELIEAKSVINFLILCYCFRVAQFTHSLSFSFVHLSGVKNFKITELVCYETNKIKSERFITNLA